MHMRMAVLLTLGYTVGLTAQTRFESTRTIQFAGRTWEVRTGFGQPGPNFWSDSPQNVWVDGEGKLHLTLKRVSGIWRCTHVRTAEPTRYGMHRFYMSGPVDVLDRNVVFAPFLYANDSTEIDMNFSRWGWATGSNLQYVVQPGPYLQGDNINAFSFRLNGASSTHYIDWSSSHIRFKSVQGHYQEPPDSSFLIQEWTYSGSRNPRETSGLSAQLSLWLIDGRPPTDGREVEIIITGVDLPSPTTVAETPAEIPTQYLLLQNYPNPFNPTTTISFALPSESFVSLKVFDLLGRERATLANEKFSAGYHALRWNAEGLPSGIYFYRLHAGGFTMTRRLLLLR
jgi:hypothetical protein